MYTIILLVVVVVIAYGGLRLENGTMSTGTLIAFLLYILQINYPLTSMGIFYSQLQKSYGATIRINELFTYQEESYEGIELEIDKQPLIFSNIYFSYEDNKQILKGVSFQAELGEKIAFVGPSGGGKTTLFSLIERFYLPDSGEILIGKTKINDVSLPFWRSQIGYVSQDSTLFNGTIRENLVYGLDDPQNISNELLWEVTKMAYADEFIKNLTNGLDTEVGERGIMLSGGQKQRINIARAFLRDPKIILMDEATASLDAQSEGIVQNALFNLMKGRTTFVIAHRLSTIVDADQILFIENGEITGKGTHTELIKNHSMYSKYAEQQLTL